MMRLGKKQKHFHKREPFLMCSEDTHPRLRVPNRHPKDPKKPVNDAEI